MLFLNEGDRGINRVIQIRAVLRGARDDQRRARLIHKDRVDLIDNREIMASLRHLRERAAHIVPQVIKPQLVIRGIGDIGGIGLALFTIRLARINNPCCHPKRGEHLAHPFGVAFGEIVVDGHDMNAFTRQRVQIGRESRDKGFTLTRFHFRNIALMQEDATHQLHIKGPQTQGPFRGFAAIGESLGQQVIQRCTTRYFFAKFIGFGDDPLIREGLELRLESIDPLHKWIGCFYLAVIWRPKDLFRNIS